MVDCLGSPFSARSRHWLSSRSASSLTSSNLLAAGTRSAFQEIKTSSRIGHGIHGGIEDVPRAAIFNRGLQPNLLLVEPFMSAAVVRRGPVHNGWGPRARGLRDHG